MKNLQQSGSKILRDQEDIKIENSLE